MKEHRYKLLVSISSQKPEKERKLCLVEVSPDQMNRDAPAIMDVVHLHAEVRLRIQSQTIVNPDPLDLH